MCLQRVSGFSLCLLELALVHVHGWAVMNIYFAWIEMQSVYKQMGNEAKKETTQLLSSLLLQDGVQLIRRSFRDKLTTPHYYSWLLLTRGRGCVL